MGFLQNLFPSRRGTETASHRDNFRFDSDIGLAVGADQEANTVSMTFDNQNATFTGDLKTLNVNDILRDKQRNIYRLFELSDYYTDSDPLVRGIVKEVYTPFSISENWRLVGSNERVKKKFEDYYKRIDLRDLAASVFLQYYKYANVYCYLMEDGMLKTLPVHLIRIANVAVNGEPVLEMNCQKIANAIQQQTGSTRRKFLKDDQLDVRLKGFPKEVAEGIKSGAEYVQLNPANTFVLQDLKEDWTRYSIPMIASCLTALNKKEMISTYENSLLNLGARAFVHVKYGDPKNAVLPTAQTLGQVQNLFRKGMTGHALVVTNNWCEAAVVQPKTDDIFEYDKYKGVNSDILSSGGISGIIVSGHAEDGSTFASAQVSMQTAAIRIKQAKDAFCVMMDKVNKRLNEKEGILPHSAEDRIPKFTFPPVNLTGSKEFQEACLRLWEKGVVSHETLLQTYGYDIEQEVERKKNEKSDKTADVLTPPQLKATTPSGSPNEKPKENEVPDPTKEEGKRGRPEMDNNERTSDPLRSQTGKQPKPSNPEGSL